MDIMTLLVNASCPKFHVLGVRFIRGMFRTFASFDCRLQGRFSERFWINQQSPLCRGLPSSICRKAGADTGI